MRRFVCIALRKNDGLKRARIEWINRGGAKRNKWNLELNPFRREKVSGERRKVEFRRELSTTVQEADARERGRGQSVRRIAPEIKARTDKMNRPTAKSDDVDLCRPPAVANGSPGKAERGRRRKRNFRFDRKLFIHEFERAGRSGVSVTIEIGVAREAVIENDVLIIATISESLARRGKK